MREHPMTKWDAGNILTDCADKLSEEEYDLRKAGFIDLADVLKTCRYKIGRTFNRVEQHAFKLPTRDKTEKQA